MTMEKYNKILKEIEEDLNLMDFRKEESNLDYFLTHKNRYKNDLEIIEHYHKNKKEKILEIGSFPFHLTYCLKKLNYSITGLAINPDRAKSFIDRHNLIVKKCDIEKEKMPFDDNSFNFIIFSEVFEHLRIDPISSLKEINRILKPDGIMILATPNLYSLGKIILFNLGKGFNNPYEEFEKIHTIGHMGHIREYSTKEVREFLENTGFKIIKIKYKVYNKIQRKIIGPILDLCYFIIPQWRPFQIIISKKN